MLHKPSFATTKPVSPGFKDYICAPFKGAYHYYALTCVSMGKMPRENGNILSYLATHLMKSWNIY